MTVKRLLDGERLSLTTTHCAAGAMLASAAAWVQAELARLLPEWGTPPPPITTDAERLRSALVNLISNARNAVAEARAANQSDGSSDVTGADDIASESKATAKRVRKAGATDAAAS